MITLTKISPLTKKPNKMELPITIEELDAFNSGSEHIQNVFPDLSADEREFIMTGYTPEDWAVIFPPEDG